MSNDRDQPLAFALRSMAGPMSHVDGADAELLMQAADIIDAVVRYRAVVAKYADGPIMESADEEGAAEREIYALLDAANADAAEVANARRG